MDHIENLCREINDTRREMDANPCYIPGAMVFVENRRAELAALLLRESGYKVRSVKVA